MFDSFCTDLIALFANHVFGCDDCFGKLFGSLLIFFVVIGLIILLISSVFDFLYKLFSKLFDRVRYKKRYDILTTNYSYLKEYYEKLSQDLWSLEAAYAELQKEYYHTCN